MSRENLPDGLLREEEEDTGDDKTQVLDERTTVSISPPPLARRVGRNQNQAMIWWTLRCDSEDGSGLAWQMVWPLPDFASKVQTSGNIKDKPLIITNNSSVVASLTIRPAPQTLQDLWNAIHEQSYCHTEGLFFGLFYIL